MYLTILSKHAENGVGPHSTCSSSSGDQQHGEFMAVFGLFQFLSLWNFFILISRHEFDLIRTRNHQLFQWFDFQSYMKYFLLQVTQMAMQFHWHAQHQPARRWPRIWTIWLSCSRTRSSCPPFPTCLAMLNGWWMKVRLTEKLHEIGFSFFRWVLRTNSSNSLVIY